MPILENDWSDILNTLGFESERSMLQELYVEQRLSINQLAQAIGFSAFAVRRRLIVNNIPLRARGGPNHVKTKLSGVSDKILMSANRKRLAIHYNVHPSTISAEKRRRFKDGISSNSTDSISKVVLSEDEMADVPSSIVGE